MSKNCGCVIGGALILAMFLFVVGVYADVLLGQQRLAPVQHEARCTVDHVTVVNQTTQWPKVFCDNGKSFLLTAAVLVMTSPERLKPGDELTCNWIVSRGYFTLVEWGGTTKLECVPFPPPRITLAPRIGASFFFWLIFSIV